MPPREKRARHRWIKVKLHVYICRQCGAGSVNSFEGKRGWITTVHYPDGTSEVSNKLRPCARGPKSDVYLAKYESAIACATSDAGWV
jgi:hypothetical protein